MTTPDPTLHPDTPDSSASGSVVDEQMSRESAPSPEARPSDTENATTPKRGAATASEHEATTQPEGAVVLVRRSRKLSLGGWIVVCLALGIVAGIVTALVAGVNDLSTILYFGATGLFFVGLPLGAIAGIVDGIRYGKQDKELKKLRRR